MYHDDADYVDGVIQRALQLGNWRDDPNMPGDVRHRQFWVVTRTAAQQADEQTDKTQLQVTGTPNTQQLATLTSGVFDHSTLSFSNLSQLNMASVTGMTGDHLQANGAPTLQPKPPTPTPKPKPKPKPKARAQASLTTVCVVVLV
jgi:hypothetical protein